MTPKQEAALREYLQESIVPLIEQVLVKKLGQAMSFAAEQLIQPKPAQQQEPVAWLWELTGEVTTDPDRADGMWLPLYTSQPASKPWVGLTEQEENELWEGTDSDWELMKRTEAKLREKNA